MKLFLTLALVCFALLTTAQAQQEPDAKYISIYALIEQGENLAGKGQPAEAAAAFTDAQNQLLQFQRVFPDWNPVTVKFRLKMLTERLAEFKQLPVPVTGAGGPTPAATTTPAAMTGTEQSVLASQLQAMQRENATLQAKLKEALAVQPAAPDLGDLARAQQQVISLMKENDLLKVNQRLAREKAAAATNSTGMAKKYNDERERAGKLAAENEQFKQQAGLRTEELSQAKKELDAYVRKYAAEQARAAQLATENEQLKSLPASSETVAALREANAKLTRQLAALPVATTNAPDVAKLTADLKAAEAQLEALRGESATYRRDKELLEIDLKKLSAPAQPQASGAEKQISSLTAERDELMKKLDAANRKNARRKGGSEDAEITRLNLALDTLRARVEVMEARPVPLSAEELALFRQPTPTVNAASAKKSITELPAGTAELVASARQHFARQEFDQAGADYLKILSRDQNNGIALANLATIELQQGKLDDAEKHLQTALAQSPDDAYNLSTLGYLKFLQEKYDEALGILSRAAKIDPNNPEIQNYLGVTLSHKGLRVPAETALRKAVAIAPDYAPAHNNLAVIYLAAEPSSPLLARWHYQKAVSAGQPRNPEFEKALAAKGAPVEIQ